MASTDKTTSWPPPNGLATIHVPRSSTIMVVSSSIRINAPASLVWEVLLDLENYKSWCQFSPEVTIHSQPDVDAPEGRLQVGTSFTFHAIMDASKPHKTAPTQLRCTDLSTPDHPSDYVPATLLETDGSFTADLSRIYRVSWKCEGSYAALGLLTERFHEVIILGQNECEVRTWENQGGTVARAVKWMYSKVLNEKFKLWVEDLKGFCEKKVTES